jgi:VCBS repeat-containing protein
LPTDDLYSFIGGQNGDVVYTDEVLLNDIDPDGDTLNVVAVNQDSNNVGMAITLPSGASLTVEADGSFLYDPGNYFNYLHAGDTATETFDYTVSDGERNTEVATVTIVMEGNNDPPMAADDTETTTEDMTVSSSVLLNDSDPERDPIQLLIVDTMNGSTNNVGQEITLPSGAKVTLTSDGLYTFDPNGQYESLNDSDTALVTFEYTITDGFGGTAGATATIVITGVNDPPVAENDDLGPAPAGLPVTHNLLTNDINPEQNELVVTEVEGQSVSSSGSTTINLSSGALMTIDGSTGEMTVDPNGQFDSLNGSQTATITFEYVVADGNGVTDSAIVTLTLQGSNDPPFAEDVSKATRPGSVVSATLLDNDGDPENDPLTVTHV